MTGTPIKYRIEIHLDSYTSDPIAGIFSSTPFMTIQKGDEIDPYAWGDATEENYTNKDEVPKDAMLAVEGIRHQFMFFEDHTIQNTKVLVKADKEKPKFFG